MSEELQLNLGGTFDALRRDVAERIATQRQRFACLFGTAEADQLRLTVAMATADGVELLDALVPRSGYAALSTDIEAAFWYERELHDLFGTVPEGHPRLDPLVLPLLDPDADRPAPGSGRSISALQPDEAAVPRHLHGRGVFTIPHGPVRSGVFESVEYLVETPGEDIPHVQVRVYAKHRGLERRFEGLTLDDATLLAERVEGIASVAHALAFAHAVESLAGVAPPPVAALVRVLHAELERVANHLDVALKLADAAGLAVAVARFGWHKERVLRLVSHLCGSRFGRGVVTPGGVNHRPAMPGTQLLAELGQLERDIDGDAHALMRTSSFLDRLRGTGPLTADTARKHGALGPIGKASGFHDDARTHRPYDAYSMLSLLPAVRSADGDAMARLRIRWTEIRESFHLLRQVVDELDEHRHDDRLAEPFPRVSGRAVGWAEAPQGEVLYVVDAVDGRVVRCKPRSASFHNLVLFHEVFVGDILTDFPFIEASFGLSIAGVSL